MHPSIKKKTIFVINVLQVGDRVLALRTRTDFSISIKLHSRQQCEHIESFMFLFRNVQTSFTLAKKYLQGFLVFLQKINKSMISVIVTFNEKLFTGRSYFLSGFGAERQVLQNAIQLLSLRVLSSDGLSHNMEMPNSLHRQKQAMETIRFFGERIPVFRQLN